MAGGQQGQLFNLAVMAVGLLCPQVSSWDPGDPHCIFGEFSANSRQKFSHSFYFYLGYCHSLFLFVCFKFPYLFWISRFPLKLAFGFGGEKDLKYDTTGPFFSVLSKNRCKGMIFLLSFYLKNRHRHTHESA